MKNEALFRTGSVWKSIFSMAVPSIIIILVMVLYNMADMFFVGCLGDTAQVAAVSVDQGTELEGTECGVVLLPPVEQEEKE